VRSPATPCSPNRTTTTKVVALDGARGVRDVAVLLADPPELVPPLAPHLEAEVHGGHEVLPPGEERGVHGGAGLSPANADARGGATRRRGIVVDRGHDGVEVEHQLGLGVLVELSPLGCAGDHVLIY